jgi:hypothetical protein
MPFGLSNVPSSFQAFINDVLRPYLDIFYTAYLDDVIVYSNSLAEHKKHVHAVITALENAGLQLDITKYEFFKEEICYKPGRTRAVRACGLLNIGTSPA